MANVISVNKREKQTKSYINTMRKDGSIPAIVYGPKKSQTLIQMNRELFTKTYQKLGGNHVITLDIDGKEKKDVLVKEYEIHPITKKVIHADFYEVDEKHITRANVPIELTGSPIGVKAGGILEHTLYYVHVQCLPYDLPNKITVDITNLNVGHSIHIKNLQIDSKIKVLNNPEHVIAAVVSSRKTKEETNMAGAAAATTAGTTPAAADKAADKSGAKKKK